MAAPAGMVLVTPVRTGGTVRLAWIRAWLDAYVRVLTSLGWPFETALAMAPAIVALDWIEIGSLTGEWNFNPGNVHCEGTVDPPDVAGWHGNCHNIPGIAEGPFRSYATRYDGAADHVQLVTGGRYRASWLWLYAHPGQYAQWYLRLMLAGYGGQPTDSQVADYQSVVNAMTSQLNQGS